MSEGLLDTNIFIHAHARDGLTLECRAFLGALEAGRVEARLEALVLHELSYAWSHYFKDATRQEIAGYLLTVLSWPGVTGDRGLLFDTVIRWRDFGVSFVDAYLATRATLEACAVYSMTTSRTR